MNKKIILMLSLVMLVSLSFNVEAKEIPEVDLNDNYVEININNDYVYTEFQYDFAQEVKEFEGLNWGSGLEGKYVNDNSTLPSDGYLDVLHYLKVDKALKGDGKISLRAEHLHSHAEDYNSVAVKLMNDNYYLTARKVSGYDYDVEFETGAIFRINEIMHLVTEARLTDYHKEDKSFDGYYGNKYTLGLRTEVNKFAYHKFSIVVNEDTDNQFTATMGLNF